jgi:hypothetical protein
MRVVELYMRFTRVMVANTETPKPGIVWWAQGTRDTIYFARHISDYNWTLPTPIVVSNPNYDFGHHHS